MVLIWVWLTNSTEGGGALVAEWCRDVTEVRRAASRAAKRGKEMLMWAEISGEERKRFVGNCETNRVSDSLMFRGGATMVGRTRRSCILSRNSPHSVNLCRVREVCRSVPSHILLCLRNLHFAMSVIKNVTRETNFHEILHFEAPHSNFGSSQIKNGLCTCRSAWLWATCRN